jgi:hypothetical protein
MTAKLKNPANRQRLVDLRQLVEQQDKELWRVSARVNASQSVDYGVLVAEVHRRLPPLFRAAEQEGMANVQAVVTGGVPVVHKAQDQLLSDLIGSFLCAFGLIALAMVALFCLSSSDPLERAAASSAGPPPDLVVAVARNTAAGLLSMIPNVLPAVVVFGAMGLIGIQIEIGTMLTVSVAMGIAVDDTLHYLTWFRRGIAEGRNRREAIEFAYKRCGNAMIQTTAIVGFGLLVFSLSPFGPIARFGWMMFAMLAAGLVGDLVVLPAILVGPLGAVFHSRVAPAVEVAVSKKTAAPDNAVVQS